MELVFDGPIIPVYNSAILKEYREVLSRPKFHFTKDRVFYEVVLEERKAEETYLVTGNIKHFPIETFIVTPRKMLDIIFSES